MQFLYFVEWCLSRKWVREINSDIEKVHFHPFPRACDPCMHGYPKPWQSLHQNPSFNKSKPQVRKLHAGTSLPCSPHFLNLSFSKPKNLWVLYLGLLFMLSKVKGAAPRMCIDVPFSRNYVPTWVFYHIKSYDEALRFNSSLTNVQGLLLLSIYLLKT